MMFSKNSITKIIPCVALSYSLGSHAYEITASGGTKIDANLEAVYALMHSDESYNVFGNRSAGSSNWREGYIKYGLSGSQEFSQKSSVYGAFNLISSGTWGDGDAAGFTEGSERRTAVNDAYIGWRSGDMFPTLGHNGVDVSAGSQQVTIGDGFLIHSDGLSYGDVDLGDNYDRGGAYYLAARKAFKNTAVVKLGGDQGWRSDLAWIKSDNRAQAETEMGIATLEHVNELGTLGLTYIHGMDVNERYATPAQLERDGMNVVSIRGVGSLGVEQLHLSFEYANENRKSGSEDAWYLEGGWTFKELPWSPTLTYRYSRFSENYDTLFYGQSRGYGTWFQGEVASNYAGPFNQNTKVQHIGIKAKPTENLTVGALAFDFKTIDKGLGNLDGRELDFYAEWMVNEHLLISPVVGFFQPKKSAEDGGLQLGNNSTNTYLQLIVGTFF
ncbi:hypothetical protein [Pseudomonas plecoglossicida]